MAGLSDKLKCVPDRKLREDVQNAKIWLDNEMIYFRKRFVHMIQSRFISVSVRILKNSFFQFYMTEWEIILFRQQTDVGMHDWISKYFRCELKRQKIYRIVLQEILLLRQQDN